MPRTLFSPRPATSNLPASLLKFPRGQPEATLSTTLHESTPKATYAPSPETGYSTKPVKVRIITWNMHDSLPKGDIQELFGKVPLYEPSPKSGTFPILPQDASHPHHLVVVAGQECPTPSGIPMGLSASFKILDKEREKPKIYDKSSNKKDEGFEDAIHVDGTHDNPTSGWTSMVEDYLCHGNVPSTSSNPGLESPPPKKQRSPKANRKGPYVLLVKERLMGIYMAIYIHRDLKPFVRGTSKSAVTAGLIGGRVGNKGGVGISLDIAGTTFLFLNAHLAAHEGKVNHRLANLTKIKTELSVDDFLPPGDPRSMSGDLTDRFDFTFLCGDLNFRLDISRLHADWLIAHQAFKQAFEFDQLHVLMKQGAFLKGFCEAPIDFPPTFKYDVLRTIKHSKQPRSSITLVDDRSNQLPASRELEALEETDDYDEEIEGDSLVSSNVSRPPTNPGDDDETFFASVSTPSILNNDFTSPRRSKPRSRWHSVFSPSFITKPKKLLKTKKQETQQLHSQTPSPAVLSALSSPLPSVEIGTPRKRPILRPPPILVDSSESQSTSGSRGDLLEADKGVYDSSHKKRVPSWCDRVLWKSTIQPSLSSKDASSTNVPQHSRNRIGGFLVNVFRPLSSRTDDYTPRSDASSKEIAHSTPKDVLAPRLSIIPSFHFRQLPDSSRSQRINAPVEPPTTAPALDYPHQRFTAHEGEEVYPLVQRPQTATHSIWRFLPSFLSPTHNQSHFLQHPQSSPLPLVPPPLKGDVRCLSYNTLDDRGMRRLEGRSDHRPVIGTYIAYA